MSRKPARDVIPIMQLFRNVLLGVSGSCESIQISSIFALFFILHNRHTFDSCHSA